MKAKSTILETGLASAAQLEFALKFLGEEHEKLYCLAYAILQRVEPVVPDNPAEDDDITAWRLAQILVERLEKTEFTDAIRSLVLGEV